VFVGVPSRVVWLLAGGLLVAVVAAGRLVRARRRATTHQVVIRPLRVGCRGHSQT
jgi:hypothetical protein